jgi:superoxide dismutase, Cu-Zn family
MKTIHKLIAPAIIILAVTGMALTAAAQDMTMSVVTPTPSKEIKAVCMIYPTAGNKVSGTITFTKTAQGVHVVANLAGLSKGKHGMHVHEFGDCSAPDGTSAGGHYNPMQMKHAGPMDDMRHEGDLGNIEADETGKATLDYTDPKLELEGMHSIIGRSVIVHASEDDMKTQPTGNSGARIGCGVIGVAK